jgi:aryl-alcohol dehydrogenase-like predicted oxidoreductase
MLPIPGTSSIAHLDENLVAGAIHLTDDQYAALDAEGRSGRGATRGYAI